jgi:hypothetical protein
VLLDGTELLDFTLLEDLSSLAEELDSTWALGFVAKESSSSQATKFNVTAANRASK